jgi:hypothetical protein
VLALRRRQRRCERPRYEGALPELPVAEVARLKKGTTALSTNWLLAGYDGTTLHHVPDVPTAASLL